MRTRLKQGGLALVMAMLLLAVLTMISVAFFEAYRSHFALTRSTIASAAAASGCESVHQYIKFRLEHDRYWGSKPFEGLGYETDGEGLLVLKQVPGTHNFRGEIKALNVEFEGTLLNNLMGGGTAAVAAVAPEGKAFGRVVCRSGDSSRAVEFMFSVAPLFDASVLTRADLNVGAHSLSMRSLDANRNMIRSEGDIYIPDVLYGSQSQFLLPNSTEGDDKGLLWAKGDIHSYAAGTVGMNPTTITPELTPEAMENVRGKIVTNAESHFSIFDLKVEDLELPEDNFEGALDPGRWNFVRRQADVDFDVTYADDPRWWEWDKTETYQENRRVWVDVLEYYSDPNDSVPTRVYRGAERTSDLAAQLDPTRKGGDIVLAEDTIETKSVNVVGYDTTVQVVPNDVLSFHGGKLTFDLTNQQVNVEHDATIQINGPFHLTSENDPNADDEITQTPPPTLDLGYQADSTEKGGISRAAIVAEGTISISDGVTEGLGALISKGGDVIIQPKNTAQVNVDTDEDGSGILIYAHRNVILKNPNETADWSIKGLIYARQGIRMEGSQAERAIFEGTIVALQEHEPFDDDPNGIEFVNCNQIEFVYSSRIVDAFIRALTGGRLQIESAYWKR